MTPPDIIQTILKDSNYSLSLFSRNEIESPQDELATADPIFDEDGTETTFDSLEIPITEDGDAAVDEPWKKVYINGVNVTILNERLQYLDGNGKFITGRLNAYTNHLISLLTNGIRQTNSKPLLKN